MSLKKNKRGFTLVEVLVAMFIFALVMTAVAGTFASNFAASRSNRERQRQVESAQAAVNVMSKMLRTSSVKCISSFLGHSGGSCERLRFYNYSTTPACGEYLYTEDGNNRIEYRYSDSYDNSNDCFTASSFSEPKILINNLQASGFFVRETFDKDSNPNADRYLGKVTVSIGVNSSINGKTTRVQSTVSLRDYVAAGIGN